jgi:hypothetical protein
MQAAQSNRVPGILDVYGMMALDGLVVSLPQSQM